MFFRGHVCSGTCLPSPIKQNLVGTLFASNGWPRSHPLFRSFNYTLLSSLWILGRVIGHGFAIIWQRVWSSGWPAGWNIGSKLHASDRVWKEVSKNKFQVLLKCFLCFWNKNIPLFSHFWELHYQARSVIKGRNSYLTILLVCLCAVWDFCRERMQICTDLLIQDKASTTDQARILL